MKKLVLLFAAGLLLGGASYAKDENGALGFGILSEGEQGHIVSSTLRGNMFLDVGYQLAGPVFYGFEFQGDVKKMSEKNFKITQTDISVLKIGRSSWLVDVTNNEWRTTYTLWDLDVSPRGYLSFDLGDKIQVLGFAGINYNWQTLDYTIKNLNAFDSIYDEDGVEIEAGESKTWSQNVGGGYLSLVGGFRVSVGAFYADYTRFLDNTSDQVSWNSYSKNRIGLGINLRF